VTSLLKKLKLTQHVSMYFNFNLFEMKIQHSFSHAWKDRHEDSQSDCAFKTQIFSLFHFIFVTLLHSFPSQVHRLLSRPHFHLHTRSFASGKSGHLRVGAKVGVTSSFLALTSLPLIGDAESSERTTFLILCFCAVESWSWEDSARITSLHESPLGLVLRCFSAMCGVPAKV